MNTFNTTHNQLSVTLAGKIVATVGNTEIILDMADSAAAKFLFDRVIDISRTAERELTNIAAIAAGNYSSIGGQTLSETIPVPDSVANTVAIYPGVIAETRAKNNQPGILGTVQIIFPMPMASADKVKLFTELKACPGLAFDVVGKNGMPRIETLNNAKYVDEFGCSSHQYVTLKAIA